MFRSGAKLLRAGICCLVLLMFFSVLFNVNAVMAWSSDGEVTADDWELSITPSRVELVIGGDPVTIYVTSRLRSDTENENFDMYFIGINLTVSDVRITPSHNHSKVWTGQGGCIVVLPFTIQLMPDFEPTDEIRLDMFFLLTYKDNETSLFYAPALSIYIIPVSEGTWDVIAYTPTFTTMTDNEEKILYLTIQNDSSQSRTFNISPTTLHHGFGASPSSDTITIDPNSIYEWTTTLTCTGFGLESGVQYLAVTWDVTDTSTGVGKLGGQTVVTYIGAAPPSITDIEIEWHEDEMEIPFGESENAYLIIRNIGDNSITLIGDPVIALTFRAKDPIWPHDVIDPGWTALAPGENENIRVVLWAHGDPEEMDDWARIVATVEDNYGNKREALLDVRAIVGTMSLSIYPKTLQLQRGQMEKIVIRIINNENANRNYTITAAEELRSGIYWARSDPSTENIALTPYTSRNVTIEVTATAPQDGIWPYDYRVQCEQTGFVGRLEISIEILTLPTGTYAQQFSMFLLMLVPLTGSIESAGYIMSVVVILIFVMIGLAMTGGVGGSPLGTIILTVFAITLVTVFGWFPSWIMGLTILVLALGMARWMHDYF